MAMFLVSTGFLSADKILFTAAQNATVSTNVLKLKHDSLNYRISKRNRITLNL